MNRKRFKIPVILMVSVIYLMFCGYTKEYDKTQDKVYDNAGLFTSEEINSLQGMCVEAAEETKLDVAVVTTYDTAGKSSMVYADDFYDEMGFGYDQGHSGILLLIDMDNREIYISTCGIAIEYFNDSDIDDILTQMDGYMADGNYFGAAQTFVVNVGSHVSDINNSYYEEVEPWFDGNYTDYEDFKEETDKIFLSNPFIDFIIAAAASALIVFFMSLKSKARMTATANTYINRNELDIHRSTDIYLRTKVTKHKIESSSSGGGHSGGSSHRSSSGRSHGGGGHKF